METMGNLRRTHYCGEVSMADVGTEMVCAGSIAKSRDKGGIIFADLRDSSGILQLVFDDGTPAEVFSKAQSLRSEDGVSARGVLRSICHAVRAVKLAVFIHRNQIHTYAPFVHMQIVCGYGVKRPKRVTRPVLNTAVTRAAHYSVAVYRQRIALLALKARKRLFIRIIYRHTVRGVAGIGRSIYHIIPPVML